MGVASSVLKNQAKPTPPGSGDAEEEKKKKEKKEKKEQEVIAAALAAAAAEAAAAKAKEEEEARKKKEEEEKKKRDDEERKKKEIELAQAKAAKAAKAAKDAAAKKKKAEEEAAAAAAAAAAKVAKAAAEKERQRLLAEPEFLDDFYDRQAELATYVLQNKMGKKITIHVRTISGDYYFETESVIYRRICESIWNMVNNSATIAVFLQLQHFMDYGSEMLHPDHVNYIESHLDNEQDIVFIVKCGIDDSHKTSFSEFVEYHMFSSLTSKIYPIYMSYPTFPSAKDDPFISDTFHSVFMKQASLPLQFWDATNATCTISYEEKYDVTTIRVKNSGNDFQQTISQHWLELIRHLQDSVFMASGKFLILDISGLLQDSIEAIKRNADPKRPFEINPLVNMLLLMKMCTPWLYLADGAYSDNEVRQFFDSRGRRMLFTQKAFNFSYNMLPGVLHLKKFQYQFSGISGLSREDIDSGIMDMKRESDSIEKIMNGALASGGSIILPIFMEKKAMFRTPVAHHLANKGASPKDQNKWFVVRVHHDDKFEGLLIFLYNYMVKSIGLDKITQEELKKKFQFTLMFGEYDHHLIWSFNFQIHDLIANNRILMNSTTSSLAMVASETLESVMMKPDNLFEHLTPVGISNLVTFDDTKQHMADRDFMSDFIFPTFFKDVGCYKIIEHLKEAIYPIKFDMNLTLENDYHGDLQKQLIESSERFALGKRGVLVHDEPDRFTDVVFVIPDHYKNLMEISSSDIPLHLYTDFRYRLASISDSSSEEDVPVNFATLLNHFRQERGYILDNDNVKHTLYTLVINGEDFGGNQNLEQKISNHINHKFFQKYTQRLVLLTYEDNIKNIDTRNFNAKPDTPYLFHVHSSKLSSITWIIRSCFESYMQLEEVHQDAFAEVAQRLLDSFHALEECYPVNSKQDYVRKISCYPDQVSTLLDVIMKGSTHQVSTEDGSDSWVVPNFWKHPHLDNDEHFRRRIYLDSERHNPFQIPKDEWEQNYKDSNWFTYKNTFLISHEKFNKYINEQNVQYIVDLLAAIAEYIQPTDEELEAHKKKNEQEKQSNPAVEKKS